LTRGVVEIEPDERAVVFARQTVVKGGAEHGTVGGANRVALHRLA
jgi:hypothetical protein